MSAFADEDLPPAGDSEGGYIVVSGSRIGEEDTRPQIVRPSRTDLAETLSEQPYLAALEQAGNAVRTGRLAELETEYGDNPGFYLDTAEWFRLEGEPATAEALLLSALDAEGANDETLQIVAFRLERDGRYDRAVALLERYAAQAGHRPQPKRQLALALAARGLATGGERGTADLERAFRLLAEIVLEPVDDQYEGIEVIALMEANALIPHIEAAGGQWTLDERLVALLAVDMRVVIEWTADDADIDLWVDEPNGERVMYSDTLSSGGGTISNDMTSGFGPEEYVDRIAQDGLYRVRINGFDADRINPNGMGHVLVRLWRAFGRPEAERDLIDADLAFQDGGDRDDEEGARDVARLQFGLNPDQ